MNKLLSICIPTYNRAQKLGESLDQLISCISKYNIPIYISDNASTDDTKNVVDRYSEKYLYIFYHRNEINVGALKNFNIVLNLAQSKFCWLLGDDDLIVTKSIDNILKILKNDTYNMVVVNGGWYDKGKNIFSCRVKGVKHNTYSNPNDLLAELGYHMSWISTLIFKCEYIGKLDLLKYEENGFPHLMAIFNFFSNKKIHVYWEDECCVYLNSSGCDYKDKFFQYFCKDWFDIANSLKEYTKEAKEKFLYAHRDKISNMGIRDFMLMRIQNLYNYSIFYQYKDYLKYITTKNLTVLMCIAVFPQSILKYTYRNIRKINLIYRMNNMIKVYIMKFFWSLPLLSNEQKEKIYLK